MPNKPNNLSLDYRQPATRPADGNGAGVHRLAMLTAFATFPLIFMGGLVTSNHAGMSVPDWPNSYGYNMFLFPPSHWVGGILYEHTHRLMATVVGMLSIALVIWAWRREIVAGCVWLFRVATSRPTDAPSIATAIPREQHRVLAVTVLAAVIFQGVLGGLRVVLVKLDLAIVHACVAQAFFCLTAYMALVTSKWWNTRPQNIAIPPVGWAYSPTTRGAQANQRWARTPTLQKPSLTPSARDATPGTIGRSPIRKLLILGVVTVCAIYLQLIIGATMRHFDAGLAIPDLPLAYGKFLPPTTPDGLAAVNHIRAFQLSLDPVTLGQIWIHFAHRVGACIVSILVIFLAVNAWRRREMRGLATPAACLLLLLVAQLTLGVLTVLLRKPADIASAHVAVGALVLVTSFILTARAWRILKFHAVPGSVSAEAETPAAGALPVSTEFPARAEPRLAASLARH
ncbi:MAG TPA: COX15/CtaA family protein [Tepidisphaeraceae bacterium]|nr:COX15/CtaA family protein [Tepidisphaeraceae bacterium]